MSIPSQSEQDFTEEMKTEGIGRIRQVEGGFIYSEVPCEHSLKKHVQSCP